MTDLNEHVIAEAEGRTGNLLAEELLLSIERHHPHEEPGVSRETIDRYAETLAEEGSGFDAEGFTTALDEHLTDAETWQDEETIYALDDDRVSRYPARWHEALGGSTDVPEYVRFLTEEVDGFEQTLESGGTGHGVPESELLDIVAVVGRVDREAAKARVEELRDSGELAEDADQHPDARVRLPERTDNLQDSSLDS